MKLKGRLAYFGIMQLLTEKGRDGPWRLMPKNGQIKIAPYSIKENVSVKLAIVLVQAVIKIKIKNLFYLSRDVDFFI